MGGVKSIPYTGRASCDSELVYRFCVALAWVSIYFRPKRCLSLESIGNLVAILIVNRPKLWPIGREDPPNEHATRTKRRDSKVGRTGCPSSHSNQSGAYFANDKVAAMVIEDAIMFKAPDRRLNPDILPGSIDVEDLAIL